MRSLLRFTIITVILVPLICNAEERLNMTTIFMSEDNFSAYMQAIRNGEAHYLSLFPKVRASSDGHHTELLDSYFAYSIPKNTEIALQVLHEMGADYTTRVCGNTDEDWSEDASLLVQEAINALTEIDTRINALSKNKDSKYFDIFEACRQALYKQRDYWNGTLDKP